MTSVWLVVAACTAVTEAPEPLPWATTLAPIDARDQLGRPADYKGLALALVVNAEPSITPVRGVIGVVCIGMSNAFQECERLRDQVNGAWASQRNLAVRVVNCAVGSHAIERWNDTSYDGTLWDACRSTKLAAAGVAEDQVLVLYHKAANQFTLVAGVAKPLYPHPESDYAAFQANLSAFAARVPLEFPSVRAVYTSSRSYGGFSASVARGEPLSYEEGHALNGWLAAHAEIGGVWYGWGPYLWAPECSTRITNGAGVCYERADYVADGVHPSATGESKVASMLHARFLREAWYRP